MDLERRIAYGLLNLPRNTMSQDQVVLTDFQLKPTDDGWLVILKGTRKGRKLIAFVHERRWRDALRTTTTMLDSSHLRWRLDRPLERKR